MPRIDAAVIAFEVDTRSVYLNFDTTISPSEICARIDSSRDCHMKVVPELVCSDIAATKKFYRDVLGFTIKFERLEEKFVYFSRQGVDCMCEELAGPGRRWITGEMQRPFGRGINFQWEVTEIESFYEHVSKQAPNSIYMPIEEKTYESSGETVRQKQFIVQDLDGYLFRFCQRVN